MHPTLHKVCSVYKQLAQGYGFKAPCKGRTTNEENVVQVVIGLIVLAYIGLSSCAGR